MPGSERGMIMKPARLSLIIIVLAAVISLEGCAPKVWSVDFTDYQNETLSDWSDQTHLSPADYVHDGTGLYFDNHVLIAPFGFDTDFTLTLNFTLDVGAGNSIPKMQAGLVDYYFVPGMLDSVDNLYAEFANLGDGGIDYYNLYDSSVSKDYKITVDGLKPSADNELVLIKTGNHIKVLMNDSVLSDVDYEYCWMDYFYPFIYLDTSSQDQIRLKAISVEYKGSRQSRD